MADGFPRHEVDDLLASCHRRCCICHRFCGVKMETDHILPQCEGGSDAIANAIPVCFECHAEIHSYNIKHPRGRRFRPEELQRHKDRWLQICREAPAALLEPSWRGDVGPLQALIDELEFNARVAGEPDVGKLGCPLRDEQFGRAIREGAIATLSPTLRDAILDAYRAIGAAKEALASMWRNPADDREYNQGANHAQKRIQTAAPLIAKAQEVLLGFLGSSPEDHIV